MIDALNTFEFVNDIAILPLVIITFIILIYIAIDLSRKNPDVIRSKIFLNYIGFRKAFLWFSIFAFVLLFHVGLIYIPHMFYFILNCSPSYVYNLQQFLGLILSLIMLAFVYTIYRNIK